MFQIDWAQKGTWGKEAHLIAPHNSQLNREEVRSMALLHWEEHCHECAIPTCYTSCSLYVPRADNKCSRFVYGIYPNPSFKGLFDFGADIRFRRWGKLESQLYGKSVSISHHRYLDRANRLVSQPLKGAANNAQALPNGGLTVIGKTFYSKVRNKYFVKGASAGEKTAFDAFVLECFSPEDEPFRLVLEYFHRQVKMRQSFDIKPGWNFYTLPAEAFGFGPASPVGKLTLAPENNAEKRLIFTWLDLVRYSESHRTEMRGAPSWPVPAAKVKCVAWDLDNTLWRGILAEDSEAHLEPRAEAVELIKKLDERGIIQTVVSKNNFADAWSVIQRLGLQDYFLYPAINWQPKSSNLKDIAEKLNLNADAFALIDDSPFERAEVEAALPQVRVYCETQLDALLSYKEFDVPVSESSKKRRFSYLTEIKREQEKEAFGGDYEAFLRSCGMKLRLFTPCEDRHILRCLELIQRANQLNLSNTRYSEEEFRELLARPGFLCIAMDCEDRFGAYGIVGFASVDETGAQPILRDLVLSCRVAQKRVEHTFVQWLAGRARVSGAASLRAEMIRTERNQPIVQVFDDLRFRSLSEKNGRSLMEVDATMLLDGLVVIEAADELGFDACYAQRSSTA
jgi:FkbH-like protein